MVDDRQESRIELPSRLRRSDEGDLDITPMIDITFLLLAFFIVVSKMDPTTAVDMPRARYGENVQDRTAVIVVVVASDTDEPAVYLGKAKKPEALCGGAIEDIEDQIAEYVQQQMRDDPLKTTVIIKGERKVKYRHMDVVKRAVSRHLEEGQVSNIGIEEE